MISSSARNTGLAVLFCLLAFGEASGQYRSEALKWVDAPVLRALPLPGSPLTASSGSAPLAKIPPFTAAPATGSNWKLLAGGFIVGSVATHLVLHSGGSTSLCDRDRNQDAMGRRECVAITVAGGVAGAGLAALAAAVLRRDGSEDPGGL